MLNKLNTYFTGKSPIVIALSGIGMITVFGITDYLIGPEISFSLFYAIPVSFVSWYGKKELGLSLAVAAALSWMLADQFSGHTYAYAAIPFWNAFVRLSFFVIITLLIVQIKRMFDFEESLADTDTLTGLENRRAFQEKAQFELSRCK